jgi:DNA ligase (NAD+)
MTSKEESPTETVAQVANLRGRILRYDRLYYVDGTPEVSDRDYDLLFRELQELEEAHPHLVEPTSPTQRVGSALPEGQGFAKLHHEVPMLSISSLFKVEEVQDFVEKIQRFLGMEEVESLQWSCEPKFDGVSAALVYEDGALVRGLTRVDGVEGEDVTANLRTVRNLPLVLDSSKREVPKLLEVRGEVLIAKAAFDEFNAGRTERGETQLANPRNATAGAIRRNNPGEVARYPLEFHLYSAPRVEGVEPFETHTEMVAALRDWGLPDSGLGQRVQGLAACLQYHQNMEARRDELAFDVDGVVCKLDSLALRERLGTTARTTRWQYAQKFKAVVAVTTLRAIEVQVGVSGRLTPRAHLDPVTVMGVVVRHTTLHTAEHVTELGLRIGDRVSLKRAGDVIPKIMGVERSAEGDAPRDWKGKVPASLLAAPLKDVSDPQPEVLPGVAWRYGEVLSMPTHCPVCGTEVEHAGKYYSCPNTYACRPQLVGRTALLAGRKGLEIDAIGEKLIEQLYEEGMLKGPADLFHLKEEELATLDGWGEKSAAKLMGQLQERRCAPFARLLTGLSIPGLGEATGRLLARSFSHLNGLQRADLEELEQIDGIGPIDGARIVEWFSRAESHALFERLFEGGLTIEYPVPISGGGPFEGKTVVFTGSLVDTSRAEAKKLVEDRGGRVSSSVSPKTDYLVQGGKPGSKAKKAEANGVRVLLEEDFQGLLADDQG